MVLRSRDGALRKVARASLVAIGPLAVSPLIECLSADSKAARWEATKALGQIADPSAARALVGVLKDDDFGVRWLAADALTRLGVSGLEPLLGALLENPDSGRLREGTHHVLRALSSEGGPLAKVLAPVISALDAVGREDVVAHVRTALNALVSTERGHRRPRSNP